MTSKRDFWSLLISIIVPLLLLVFPAHVGTAAKRANTRPVDEAKQRAAASYGKLPLSFEINQGQTDPRVKFLSRGNGYTLFLTGNEAVLSLQKKAGEAPPFRAARTGLKPGATTSVDKPTTDNGARTTNAVLRTRLVGANLKAAVSGAEELPGKSNYFIGNDPQKWRTNVPNYSKVRYQGVYPGVDLVYYGNQGGRLEYDFVVAPGADPSVVTLEVGAGGVRPAKRELRSPLQIAADGDLVIKTDGGAVRFQKPVVYQPAVNDGQRTTDDGPSVHVDGHYALTASNQVRFALGPYDHTKPLVIDPTLIYSTYLGGSGYGLGVGIAVDSSGNAYVTGTTSSINFPIASPLQATYGGGTWDAFVAKLNAAGSALDYSTYLGGSGNDFGSGIAVDSSGNAYVTGSTGSSTDFPIVNALQTTYGGGDRDAFVAKLNATGSALVYSTYLGGSYEDDGNGIAVDASGNAYVTGSTESTNFPTKYPLQPTNEAEAGYGTAFVAKLNFNATTSALTMVYSTYLGGSYWDQGSGIAVDSSGNAYVTGQTWSTNFPTVNPLQASNENTSGTAFVAKLNSAGSALAYSTYLGGSSSDFGKGIAVDSSGNAYVTGLTSSTDFPTANPLQATNEATPTKEDPTAFVAKLNSTGTALLYSTYLGGSYFDQGSGIAVDSSGNAYVTGQTYSTDFPTVNPLQATNENTSGTAFVAELNSTGSALVYSTYLGGSSSDWGYGVAVDSSGNAYVSGQTSSTNFPTVNPLQATNKAAPSGTAFVAKISPAYLPGVSLIPLTLTFSDEMVGMTSSAQTVTLANVGSAALAISSIVASGDFAQTNTCGIGIAGGTSCLISVTFTPTAVGTQTGTLTITDDSNGVEASTQTVGLSGTGVFASSTGPAVSLEPANLSFPDQGVGTTSSSLVVTLTNSGVSPLTISNIATSANYTQTNTCLSPSPTLASLANCSISLTFTPTVAGSDPGTLTITDNSNGVAGSMQTVGLSGTGTFPVPQIEQPLVPAAGVPGGAQFTLTVNGTGFVSSSVVNWNASPLATNFVNGEQLTATVPAANIATAGTALVTVVSPTRGSPSNTAFFQIASPRSSATLSRVDYPTNTPSWVATGDFNGDGKLDLAVVNSCGADTSCATQSGTVSILLGNGDGTFRAQATYATGAEPLGISVGDFNGDGKLDLAILNNCGAGPKCPWGQLGSGTVSILLGNGDGTFQPQTTYATGAWPCGISMGDFNGDGKLDLAVANSMDNTVSILLGNGDGTFQPQTTYATGAAPFGISVGDFNGDGKLDLAVANQCGDNPSCPTFSGTVSILLGNGDGTFQPQTTYPTGAEPLRISAADFNGDGKLDLAVTNECGADTSCATHSSTVSILLGNGDGTFQPQATYATGAEPFGISTGDFNGDGKLDLAVANTSDNTVSILLGNGDGTFQTQTTFATGAGPGSVTTGDFNGDGRLDLAVANAGSGTVSVLLQAPLAGLSGNSLTFSSQVVGTTSSSQAVTLTNTGTAPMAISSASLSGANAANFALPGNTCPMLTPPASCAASTGFFTAFPVVSPPFSSILYVTAPNGNGDRLVVGTPTGGTAAFISALNLVPAPNALNQEFCDFVQLVTGVQALAYVPSADEREGNFSAFAGLLINPATGLAVPGGVLSPTSTFWAWRVPANAFSPPASLAPGATCAINVSFSPLTAGASSAQVTIGDNAPGAFQVISLSGTGTSQAGVSATSLTFPATDVGSTTSSQTLTLTNNGTGSMSFNITTTPGFSETDNCGSTLAAGASCTITITSTPTDVGTQTGQLIISGEPGGPVVVALTVQGILTSGNIATLAGGGRNSPAARSAYIPIPTGAAVDTLGNLYVVAWPLNQVLKVGTSGNVSVLAGTGAATYSGDGGPATGAGLYLSGIYVIIEAGVAVDAAGNVFIADVLNNRIRRVDAATGIITTVAGKGTAAYSGDGGFATSASLWSPTGVAVDGSGNLFIADGNNVIRRVNASTGTISTVAGVASCTTYGSGDGGPATSACLNNPVDVAVDGTGNDFIADTYGNVIRRVDASTGIISTVAGGGSPESGIGDGGPATSASLYFPSAVTLDASANLFISDSGHNVIRRVDASTGTITTVAGNSSTQGFSGDGGSATSAALNLSSVSVVGFGYPAMPASLAVDAAGNLFIPDSVNNRVRRVDATTGVITTVAGGGSGGDGGPATSGILASPVSLATDSSGNAFVGEGDNFRVRRVDGSTGVVTTVAGNGTSVAGFVGDGGPATSAGLASPIGLAVDSSGNLFISEEFIANRIRRVDADTGIITTFAGTGTCGYNGNSGAATSVEVCPRGLAVDAAGNLFIADRNNNRIRRVEATTGNMTTIAGSGPAGLIAGSFSGDGGPATSATLNSPFAVAFDGSGNLFINDEGNGRIRVVNTQATAITVAGVVIQAGNIATVAGNGSFDYSGDGGPATSASLAPSNEIAVDSLGNIFLADISNNRIRRVDATTGIITTVAGSGATGAFTGSFSGDGGPATSASLNDPYGVALGSSGNLLIADTANNRIREVLLAPAVTLSTTSLTFADQLVGTSSSWQTVTVTSTGGLALSIANIVANGDYAQTNTCPVSPATLNPGSTCTISVIFTPTGVGTRTGTVTITDNSNGVAGSTQTVDLSGTGVALIAGMAVSLAPPSLVFPAQSVGNSSSPLVVTLTNSGVSPLTISNIATSGDYAQTNTCPIPTATLPAGSKCTISVTFTPTVSGSDPGTLTITDNASDSPQSVPLAATFTTPPQPVSPGTSTTFTNGTIVSETVTLPSDVDMGATASKEVSFIPVSPAAFSQTRLPGTPQSPDWSGGSTPIPTETTCTVIANTGGNCIVIRDLCFDSNGNPIACDITAQATPIQLTAHYETPSSPSCPGYIIADDGQTNWAVITNLYYPGDTTIGGGTKKLNTDTAVVDLGAGYCATSKTGPAVSLAPLSLVFPAQEVGTASSPLVVKLTNTGASPLTISNIVTSGDYAQTNTCPIPSATLAVGSNCSISVTFTPTVSGFDPGMLTITDNASNSPQSIPLATSTPQQPVSPGTSTTFNGTIAFTNGTVMTETVTLPPDAVMNGTASKAVSFIEMPPAVFSSTRLPPTAQNPNWSGGITPIPTETTCTVIANTGGNCIVIRDLCFDSNGNPIACNITAPTIPIQLTAHYETPSSPSCPGYVIADDDQTNWAIITNLYYPGDTTIGGGTKKLNTDTVVVDLGAGTCSRDKTPPVVTVTGVTNGATYPLGAVPTAGCSTTDAISGVATPATLTLTGGVPPGVGTFTATCSGAVDVAGNPQAAPVTATYTVTPGPVASVSPSSIDFGTVYLGTITTKNVTVKNLGDVPMTITNPLLTIVSGGNSNEFVAVNLCPKSLAAGKSCTISVSFVAGPFYTLQTATLTVKDNAPYTPSNPQTVALSATVINPQAHLSVTSLSFSRQKVGTSSAAKAVTLKNTGTTLLTINSITMAGTNPGDFALASGTTCVKGGTLAATASCTINVTFKPTTTGSRSASVVITDNAQNSPQKISLSGTGD